MGDSKPTPGGREAVSVLFICNAGLILVLPQRAVRAFLAAVTNIRGPGDLGAHLLLEIGAMIMEAKKRPSSTRSRMLDGGIYDYSGGL